MFFLACCGGAVVSFCRTSALSKYLNTWTNFVFAFTKTFPEKCINLQYVRKMSGGLMTYCIVLCTSYIFAAVYLYRTCIFNFNGRCNYMEREQAIVLAVFGCVSSVNTCFEQYKLSVFMTTTHHSFQQVRLRTYLFI